LQLHLNQGTILKGEERFFQQSVADAEPFCFQDDFADRFLRAGGFACLHCIDHPADLLNAVTPRQSVGYFDFFQRLLLRDSAYP
jgi:hypothetical protein